MSGIEFLLGTAASLLATAIDRVLIEQPSRWVRRQVDRRIEDLTDAVIEPMVEYFKQEGIDEETTKLIAKEAETPVRLLIETSDEMIARGLDVNAITAYILEEKLDRNASMIAEEYPAPFATMLRAYVDLAVRTPPLFADWEQKQFAATYQKLREFEATLARIYGDMRKVAERHERGEALIDRIIAHEAGQLALKMSMHGLRSSELPQTDIDNLFILPHFAERKLVKKGKELSEPERLSKAQFDDYFSPGKTGLRCVVVAPAGAGKTTWTEWLGSQLINAPQKAALPINIRLRLTIKNPELPTLTEAVRSVVTSTFHDKFEPHDIESWVNDAKLTLLLDGFDEVPESKRDSAWGWINSLAAADPDINIVVTSRPLTTSHIQILVENGYRHLDLEPFDEDQVENYIAKYKEHGPSIQTGAPELSASELAHTWRNDPSLRPLTANPLLLSTLLAVHRMDGELPQGRAALYERYVDGMLGAWENRKELAPPDVALTKQAKRRILELIAINMIANEVDAVDENEAAKWISPYLKEICVEASVDTVLENLRERSGLLIGPGQYSFAHKSIGEFLVACACHNGIARDANEQRYDRMLLTRKSSEDRWLMVVFLWAGLAPTTDVQLLLEELINADDLGLADGLLQECGEHLDRERRAEICWKLLIRLNEIQLSGKSVLKGIRSYYEVPIASPSTSSKRRWPMPVLRSPAGSYFGGGSEYFDRSWINPQDWDQYIEKLSPVNFMELLQHLGFDRNIAERTLPAVTVEEQVAWLTWFAVSYGGIADLASIFKDCPEGFWRGIAMYAGLRAKFDEHPVFELKADVFSLILESENSKPSEVVCADLCKLKLEERNSWAEMIAKFLDKYAERETELPLLISAVQRLDEGCKAAMKNQR